jgi:hypothetical protein
MEIFCRLFHGNVFVEVEIRHFRLKFGEILPKIKILVGSRVT